MKKLSPALVAAVRAAKEDDGQPLYKLAAKASIDPTVLARLLRGQVRATYRYRDRLVKLARRLGIPADQVFVAEVRRVRPRYRRDGRRPPASCVTQGRRPQLEDADAHR